ncbi:MAG TPA: 30S ribosomal protein S19e [Candidatus Dormibacteraeota bacterium]|jgi:small subunit ribosomal protein S19e|nr:30S ribosomal protein S19e [Candidatus Dormibacteraeota bacterium]
MPTPLDVPSDALIDRLSKFLKENVGEVAPPAWALNAKTGSHRERPPANPDWWYTRSASLLRKLYIHGPIGIARLRVEYGGRLRKGTHIEHSRIAGGSAIREPLQQLQKAGLISTEAKQGRKLTTEGMSLLNRMAAEILKGARKTEGQ